MPHSDMAVMAPPNLEMREAARFVHWVRRVRRAPWRYDCDSTDLRDCWRRCQQAGCDDLARFHAAIVRIAGFDSAVHWCEECAQPAWDATGWYTTGWYGYLTGLDIEVCRRCCAESFTFCDDCDEWDRQPHEHEEPEPPEACEAPHQSFEFPVIDAENGRITNDERYLVEIPGGTISEEGIDEVNTYLYGNTDWGTALYGNPRIVGSDFERQWTNKSGNFPKRVAKLFLQKGYKLTPEQVAAIGNIARKHTSAEAKRHVEFTRDLNRPASEFYYGGSCWFGSESTSLCTLKQCGGLALRTFATEHETHKARNEINLHMNDRSIRPGGLNGRAWLVPVKRNGVGLELTHDTVDADGFVVFNVYGMDGYDAARMVAQLTGKSYRRVDFTLGRAYINNNQGFLVASQEVCQRTDEIHFRHHCDCECER